MIKDWHKITAESERFFVKETSVRKARVIKIFFFLSYIYWYKNDTIDSHSSQENVNGDDKILKNCLELGLIDAFYLMNNLFLTVTFITATKLLKPNKATLNV